MTKQHLIDSASLLPLISNDVVIDYESKSEFLANAITNILLSREDINELVGENNISMMKDNHANHVRFMISIMKHFNAEVFTETILWVFRAYKSHGFTSNYWPAQLNAWITLLQNELSSESYKQIFIYYNWIQVNIPLFDLIAAEQSDV